MNTIVMPVVVAVVFDDEIGWLGDLNGNVWRGHGRRGKTGENV
jgi:hypothetical protein